MKTIYIVSILILVSVLFLVIGIKIYKITNNKFKDNVVPIIGILKGELNEIDNSLKKKDLAITWKNDLLKRRLEVVSELNLFYGKDVYK
jgi:hypothetical protein